MHQRAVLFLCLSLLFYPTIGMRESTFGTVTIASDAADPSYRSLTTLGTNMASNWYVTNPFTTSFLLQLNPSTVENPHRAAYTSYPPGFLVPPYVLSKLLGRPPTVGFLMGLSLAYQLIVSFLMALLTLELLVALGFRPRWALFPSLAAGALVIYLPPGLIFFQNVWWPDVVCLVPFAAVIYLEITCRRGALQIAAMVLGLLTDWLCYPLAAFLLARRLWTGEFRDAKGNRQSRAMLGALAASCVSYPLWVWSTGNLAMQVEKVMMRIGATEESPESWLARMEMFWFEMQFNQIGWAGWAVFSAFVMVSLLRFRRSLRSPVVDTVFLAVAPIAAHWAILSQHYASHPYNGNKFVVPLALLPAVLAAALQRMRVPLFLAALVGALAAWVYLASVFPLFQNSWAGNKSVAPVVAEHTRFIRAHSAYEHVVFSPDLVIELAGSAELPELVYQEAHALAQREVHKARSVADIQAFIRKRQEMGVLINSASYAVLVTGLRENVRQLDYWRKLGTESADARSDRFYLVQLHRSSYEPATGK